MQPKELLDELISAVIKENGESNYMEWEVNEKGNLIYAKNGKVLFYSKDIV